MPLRWCANALERAYELSSGARTQRSTPAGVPIVVRALTWVASVSCFLLGRLASETLPARVSVFEH
jgi:hypothetical protein